MKTREEIEQRLKAMMRDISECRIVDGCDQLRYFVLNSQVEVMRWVLGEGK